MPSTWRSAGVRRANIHAEAASDRGAHLVASEDFALDLARFEDFLRQTLQCRFAAQAKAGCLHAPNQPPLAMADSCQAIS